ncbi:hypothetical protein [Amycolatopsis sp. WQ 127309]|uniref:hypothetical protein n=1 Tax=Amycolatopsis sp. WQ 127309 TaxID=2932773 RepID=UPI001FF5802E|nr:hypothetical protein [Amycolatopsis sp. WQ 127309]UOZ07020.1 hypothetical protein MUY22_01625 [Amycolatopsis sp. WQ 127309]
MTASAIEIWRPLRDDPLFTAELLVEPDAPHERVLAYLEQVALTRRTPLHVATAFNAVHFGFGTDGSGYRGELLDPELFFRLDTGTNSVLEVGMFVRVERGGHTLWAETVGQFGAHHGVEADGWVPPELTSTSGRNERPPAGKVRAVLDFEAFGTGLNHRDRAELARLRRRGTVLDSRGHALGTDPAMTRPHGIGRYAEWLLTSAKPLLLSGPLGGLLNDPHDDGALAAALDAALSTIDKLLARSEILRRWGLYATPVDRFNERISSPGVLGGDDLGELVRIVTRPTDQTRYTGVWPLLARAHHADVPDPLAFADAVEAVVHANLAIGDGAARLDGFEVRLDDPWQAGGVWRAAPCSAPDDEPIPDDVVVEHLDSTLTVVTVALRATHIDNGVLPLPSYVTELLPHENMIIDLFHDGEPLDDAMRVQDVVLRDDRLTGITWPFGFYPGIKVTVAAARGASRVALSTKLLDEPLPYGDDYRWAADEKLVAAALGLAEAPAPAPAAARGVKPGRGVDPLGRFIVNALRRHGEAGPFGARQLTGPQLMTALFGPEPVNPMLLWQVIHTCEDLVTADKLTCEPVEGAPDVFVWWPDGAGAPRVPDQARRPGGLAGRVKEHWVPPGMRQLPDGFRASEQAKANYAKYVRGLRGPQASVELPPGFTFVRGHRRGDEPGPVWLDATSD